MPGGEKHSAQPCAMCARATPTRERNTDGRWQSTEQDTSVVRKRERRSPSDRAMPHAWAAATKEDEPKNSKTLYETSLFRCRRARRAHAARRQMQSLPYADMTRSKWTPSVIVKGQVSSRRTARAEAHVEVQVMRANVVVVGQQQDPLAEGAAPSSCIHAPRRSWQAHDGRGKHMLVNVHAHVIL